MLTLFKANKILAVKLSQSFESLYALDFYEYSYHLKMIKDELTKDTDNGQIELVKPKSSGKFTAAADLMVE